MLKIILLKGLPASGKTTYAKELLLENPGTTKRVNKDDLRAMLDASKWSRDNEKFVLKLRDKIIWDSLMDDKHVIVDDTNLHPKHQERMLQIAQDFRKASNKDVEVVIGSEFLEVDVEECIKRDLARPNSVGEKVIRDMYDKFIKPAEEKVEYVEDKELPKAIIVDIDGTLAQMSDRSPYDWSKVYQDKPNLNVIDIVWHYLDDDKYQVIFFSGRDGVCYDDTVRWLSENVLLNNTEREKVKLYMRPMGDTRKDVVVKREMFENYIRGIYYVQFVLDDRDQVVDMWRNELGLTCLQVAEGNF